MFSFAEPLAYAGGMCGALLLSAVFLLPWLVIIGIIQHLRGTLAGVLASFTVGFFSALTRFIWMSFQLGPSLRFGADMKLAAAQQLAEADPAGWGIRWGAWPAGMRENRWHAARFRRAA